MVVIDASAVVGALLRRPSATDAFRLIASQARYEPLLAPELMQLEVLNALRKLVERGAMSLDEATGVARAIDRFPVRTYGHQPLCSGVWKLRHQLSAYDASYLVLADGFGARLLTADRRLARAAAAVVGDDRVAVIDSE